MKFAGISFHCIFLYWCCVLEPVVMLNSKTKQTKPMPQNFLEFLAVVLQFFLLGRYKTTLP